MRCGPWSSACAPAVAARCCAGRSKADDRALRRLQVAAETGQTLAFAWRAHAVRRSTHRQRPCALAVDALPTCASAGAQVPWRSGPSGADCLGRGIEVAMRWVCDSLPAIGAGRGAASARRSRQRRWRCWPARPSGAYCRRSTARRGRLGLRPGQSTERPPRRWPGALPAPNTTRAKSNAGSSSWRPGPIASVPRSACITRVRLLFEIESSLGLFGPWPQFEARLRKELTELGFRHRIVAAPNPAAARVLANTYDGLAIDDAGIDAGPRTIAHRPRRP